MGTVLEKLSCGYGKKEIKILTVGLDAAGKTTVLYKLKLGEVVTTIPTIGFNVETLDYKGTNFIAWDFGGRDKSRPLLKHYYQDTRAVILVVDSNDRERMPECKDELKRILEADELKDAIILVMANKQDLPNALTVEEVSERLEIQNIKDKDIHVQGTCACSGQGLYEGLDWITNALTQQELKKSVMRPVKELPLPREKSVSSTWWSTLTHYFMLSQTES